MPTKEQLQERIKELEAERDLLRTLIDTLPDCIYAKDAEARFLINNEAHLKLMGDKTQEDVQGKTDLEVFPGEAGEKFYADDRQILDSGEPLLQYEDHLIDESGQEHWFSVTKLPWRNQVGEIIGILGISRDITPYKTLLLENQRLVKELEQRVAERTADLATFRSMADNAMDGIIMTDMDMKLVYANQAAHEMYGYDHNNLEMLGLHASDIWPPKTAEMLQQEVFAQTMAGGWRGEAPQKRKDGTIFEAEGALFPVLDTQGNVIQTAAVIHDITHQKQAEAEREQLQQQVISAQKRIIQELSTPVIPVMDRVIVMPLIGSIDTMRARDITRTLLTGIREYQAKVVILDVTGVPIVDSGVALHLNKTIQAARLKGARTILTGITDAVAEAVVDLGIDWTDMETLSDLQTGLRFALNSLGIRLNRISQK